MLRLSNYLACNCRVTCAIMHLPLPLLLTRITLAFIFLLSEHTAGDAPSKTNQSIPLEQISFASPFFLFTCLAILPWTLTCFLSYSQANPNDQGSVWPMKQMIGIILERTTTTIHHDHSWLSINFFLFLFCFVILTSANVVFLFILLSLLFVAFSGFRLNKRLCQRQRNRRVKHLSLQTAVAAGKKDETWKGGPPN